MNQRNSLSTLTIIFHWLIAFLFIAIFCIDYSSNYIPNGSENVELMNIHQSLGIIILIIALLRAGWRLKEGPIKPDPQLSNWEKRLATTVHNLLLLFTLLMPISGIMINIGNGKGLNFFTLNIIAIGDKIEILKTIGKVIHSYSITFIIIILALHIAGALKHHFMDKSVDKDDVLS